MKRFLLFTLGCLFFCAAAAPAYANQWGLTGGALGIVMQDDTYDPYTAVADDGNEWLEGMVEGVDTVNHAVLESRYHRVLISAYETDGQWFTQAASTLAVYQPGDPRGDIPPTLEHTGVGVWKLSYGENEHYQFGVGGRLLEARWAQDDWNVVSIRGGGDSLPDIWEAHPGETFLPIGEDYWLTDGVTIQEFNITQMPRSLMELHRINTVSAALLAAAPDLTAQATFRAAGDDTRLPVYFAPDATSFRAAEGKAQVSLGGDLDVIGAQEGWSLIRYEVSNRTERIGYVEADLGGAPLELADVALTAAVDTFLTDDPFVSQYQHFAIPAGTEMTGLARCGEFYAYVEFRQNGAPARGFVPLKDLTTTYDLALYTGVTTPSADVRWDVMHALIGKWRSMPDGQRLILLADGTWRNFVPGDSTSPREEGKYRVYDGENGQYILMLWTAPDEEHRHLLFLNADGSISLISDTQEWTMFRDEYSTYGNG